MKWIKSIPTTCSSQSAQQSTLNTHINKHSMLQHSNTHTALVQTLTTLTHTSARIVSWLLQSWINATIIPTIQPLQSSNLFSTAYAADAALPTPSALIHPDLIVIALPFWIAIAMAHLNCLLTCAGGTYDWRSWLAWTMHLITLCAPRPKPPVASAEKGMNLAWWSFANLAYLCLLYASPFFAVANGVKAADPLWVGQRGLAMTTSVMMLWRGVMMCPSGLSSLSLDRLDGSLHAWSA